MKRLMNFLRGMVLLRVNGPFPERFLNLCAQEQVDFWALEWPGQTAIRLTVRRRCLGRALALARRAGCEAAVEDSRGLPDFLARFRTRYAFLLGLALALGAVGVLSRFVLTIQVTGNETVPTAVILSQLRQLGVRPGVYGPSLDRGQLAEEALLKLDGLSWMAINLHGTRLEVIVREAVKAPERVDEKTNTDIVAETDGIILRVEPELGDEKVRTGDTVAAGDVLISGTVTMEPPIYSDQPVRYYQTHARGRVWARTWRTLTGTIPLTASVKEYTGEEKQRWSLSILGKRIEIFGNSSISWPMYDKITTVFQPGPLSGGALPLFVSREAFRAYTLRSVPVERTAARALVEEALLERLKGLIGEDGEISAYRFSAREEGALLTVTLTTECREEIGKEAPGGPLPS